MKKSKVIVVIFVLSFLLSGAAEASWPSSSDAAYLIHGLIIAFLLFWWVRAHASEKGLVDAPYGAKFLSALIPPVGLPYYFYRGYGVKLGTLKLGASILILLLSLVLYAIPFYLAQ